MDTGEDTRPLFEALLSEGVIVRPLHGFGAPTAIRSLAAPPTRTHSSPTRSPACEPAARLDNVARRAAVSRPPAGRFSTRRRASGSCSGRTSCRASARSSPSWRSASTSGTAPTRGLGQRAADRRLPAGGRDRTPARAARRPAVPQAAPRRRGRRAVVVFVLLAFTVRRSDRRAGAAGRDRDRVRAAGRLRRAAEPGLAARPPPANGLLRLAEQLTITFGALIGGIVVAAAGPTRPTSSTPSASPSPGCSCSGSRGHCSSAARPRATDTGTTWRGFRLVLRSRAAPDRAPLVEPRDARGRVRERLRGLPGEGVLQRGDFGFGLMWSANGSGGDRRALRLSVARAPEDDRLYGVAIGLMGFGHIAAAVSPNVWVAFWCILLGGIGNATAIICNHCSSSAGPGPDPRPRLHR